MISMRRFLIICSLIVIATFLNVNTLLGQWQTDEVDPNNIPTAVREAIEKDFAHWRGVKWYVYDRTSKAWSTMKTEINEQGLEPDMYVATCGNGECKITAVYNKEGELVRATTILTKVEIPSKILESLKNEYPDWKVKKYEMIIRNFDFDHKYHKVKIKNGRKGKTLLFDKDYQKVEGM